MASKRHSAFLSTSAVRWRGASPEKPAAAMSLVDGLSDNRMRCPIAFACADATLEAGRLHRARADVISADAGARRTVPVERLVGLRQRCIARADRRAAPRIGRADRDVARIDAGAALEFRKADCHQSSGRSHADAIGDAFRLYIG